MAARWWQDRRVKDALCCGPVGRSRILINALSLTKGGGGHSYLVNVLRELERDSRGLDFTVLSASSELAAPETGRIEWAKLRLPALGYVARVPLRVAYEETVLPVQARRYDVLYCPADLAPAVAGTPTVVALRNLHIYDRRFYGTFRLHALERLVQAGVRRARRILFPTRAAADQISQRITIPANRIAIVPHGVSLEPFESDPAKAASAAGQTPYLFLPASVERHKRIEVLIRSLLHVEDPRLEAWIAGTEELDPTYVSELRRLAEQLGVASRVRFLGPVPYSQILDYYRGAVALAFTSHLETFGQPMLEAMLAETPIIAADIPTFREIAGDIALYFPPDDSVQLARAADEVRREPDAAKERVARGRARAAEFSWKRSVDALCEVFHQVLAEKRGGAGG
jgi:glycosyltransferase involved in cell wall biosynthesis